MTEKQTMRRRSVLGGAVIVTQGAIIAGTGVADYMRWTQQIQDAIDMPETIVARQECGATANRAGAGCERIYRDPTTNTQITDGAKRAQIERAQNDAVERTGGMLRYAYEGVALTTGMYAIIDGVAYLGGNDEK